MKQTIPIHLLKQQDLVVVQKPAGMNTHRPDPDKPGLLEFLEAQLQEKLYVVHRLDKETSGVLIFARSQALAQTLGQLFETHQVQKEYVFLTDRFKNEDEFEIESEIQKEKDIFVSKKSPRPNSKTQFVKIKSGKHLTLWKAQPKTGKPHQIRLHAQDLGIPILGDLEHGGSSFFRLCLHSEKLSFQLDSKPMTFESSIWFDTEIIDSSEFQMLEAIWKRTQFLDLSQSGTARLSHDECKAFRLDLYGTQLWMSWYSAESPDLDSRVFSKIREQWPQPMWIRQMKSRGAVAGQVSFLIPVGNPSQEWIAEENGLKFELRSDQGLSPGLFLDQRENRSWVRGISENKKVLNLFSYTGGFSVNAAAGKASEVCTVDVSRTFLDWSKQNFKLNGLQPEVKEFEFWAQDSLLFLKGCKKRGRQFDLIICDPPTLGRTKDGTFDLKRDLKELLNACWGCLSPDGKILFSVNYEGWDLKTFRQLCEQALGGPSQVKTEAAPGSPLDYESSPHESLMKSLILTRNSSKKSQ